MNVQSISSGGKKILQPNIWLVVLILVLSIGFPFSHAEASGNSFYVGTTGANSNPGTIQAPWKTIQYAVDTVNPGDTIFVRAGTYNENVILHKTGLSGSPITISGYNGETAVINGGTTNPAIAEWGNTRNIEYWVIENLTLKSGGQQTLLLGYWTKTFTHNYNIIRNNKVFGSIFIHGHHNLIEGNDVDGTGNNYESLAGIEDAEEVSHHNIIRNNTIHDISSIYGRGIWTIWRTHDNLIEGNTIKNITGSYGQCIDADGYQSVEWRHTIRGNTATNCGVVGIQLENNFDTVVENNITGINSQGGIIVISYGGYDGRPNCLVGGENNQYGSNTDCKGLLTGIKIQQNIIYSSGSVGGIVSYATGGVKVYNNIIYNGNFAGIQLIDGVKYTPQWEIQGNIFANNKYEITFIDAASIVKDDYNLFYHPQNNLVYERNNNGVNADFYSLSQYQAAFSKGLHSLTGNPLFADPANLDFSPTSGSPSIDHGVDLGITSDIDGVTRPQGDGFDIGAFEALPPCDDCRLAKSPWPMYRNNLRHTSASLYSAPITPVSNWDLVINANYGSDAVIGSDGIVYAGLGNSLYAINSNGTQRWKYVVGGNVHTPLITAGGTIYVTSNDGKLYALTTSGANKWTFSTDGSISGSPALGPDGTIYTGSSDGKLYAITPEGILKWTYPTGSNIQSSPAVDSLGTVYIGAMNQKLYSISPTGSLNWSYATGGAIESSPVISATGNIIFGSDDNKVYSLNPSGSKQWSFATGGAVFTPALNSDGTIYIGSTDGKLYALTAQGSLKWSSVIGQSLNSPAVSRGGEVLVGSNDGYLYYFYANGTLKWKYQISGPVNIGPVIGADGTVYTGSNGRLVAIGDNSLKVYFPALSKK